MRKGFAKDWPIASVLAKTIATVIAMVVVTAVAMERGSTPALASDLAFFDAVRTGNVETATALLKAGQNVMAHDDQLNTALHVAAEAGNLAMVQLLLDSGSKVDEPGRSSQTALMDAVTSGNADVTRLLLTRGADSRRRNRNGESASLLAAREGSLPLLQLLAEKGADLNAKDRDGDFPLLAAAMRGHEDAVTYLLSRKVNPNQVDSNGASPLILAAGAAGAVGAAGAGGTAPGQGRLRNGSLRIVRELVDAGAKVNAVARDAGGATPLYTSLFSGNRVIAAFLLDHGADTNLRRHDGSTDFAVIRTACDLRRMPAYQEKFRDLRCDNLIKAGSYAHCGPGGDSGAALAAVDIPEANTNLIKMPALRYSCPGTGGRSCVIESHDSQSIGEGDEGEEGHQDWRRSIRFPNEGGTGPNDAFVWTPEACGAGCGKPEIALSHMAPAQLKLGKGQSSGSLLLKPWACPKKGKCSWLDPKAVRGKQKLAALPGPRGFYCVRVEESEDTARYGWMPAAKITVK